MVRPHLTGQKATEVQRWLAEWGDKHSATNIGIPISFLWSELARRCRVTGKSKRRLGVDCGGGLRSARLVRRDTLNNLLYSERLEDLCAGDLVWDMVTSVEYVGELPCFDFEMVNAERPYAIAEDFLVHNCGKKNRAVMKAEREKFVAGCTAVGYGASVGEQLFDIIEPFADYAFNKSHSYGYGLVSFQTAWLKAHYPVEYFAALLTSISGDKEKTALYLAELRTRGIPVLVPDVNRSGAEFGVDCSGEKPSITFGLTAVRNVGSAIIDLVVAERDTNGPFRDFYDFANRVDAKALNKRALESLIRAGAFESFGYTRKGLLMAFDEIVTTTLKRKKEAVSGRQSLFDLIGGETISFGEGVAETLPVPTIEFERSDLLATEKEMLGLYVSDHPLNGFEYVLSSITDTSIAELRELALEQKAPEQPWMKGEVRTTGGLVTELVRKRTKKGDVMATFVLEDLSAAIEVVVFPKDFEEYGSLLIDDTIVVVRGRLDVREDRTQLICVEVMVPDLVSGEAAELRIELGAEAAADEAVMERLKRVLTAHPGPSPVLIVTSGKSYRLSPLFSVSPRKALMRDLSNSSPARIRSRQLGRGLVYFTHPYGHGHLLSHLNANIPGSPIKTFPLGRCCVLLPVVLMVD